MGHWDFLPTLYVEGLPVILPLSESLIERILVGHENTFFDRFFTEDCEEGMKILVLILIILCKYDYLLICQLLLLHPVR